MKTYFKYYVVDNVTESVIGSFDALNLDMACMMIQKGVFENPKLKDFVDQYSVYFSNEGINVCETYDEVLSSLKNISNIMELLNDRRKNDNGCSVATDD